MLRTVGPAPLPCALDTARNATFMLPGGSAAASDITEAVAVGDELPKDLGSRRKLRRRKRRTADHDAMRSAIEDVDLLLRANAKALEECQSLKAENAELKELLRSCGPVPELGVGVRTLVAENRVLKEQLAIARDKYRRFRRSWRQDHGSIIFYRRAEGEHEGELWSPSGDMLSTDEEDVATRHLKLTPSFPWPDDATLFPSIYGHHSGSRGGTDTNSGQE